MDRNIKLNLNNTYITLSMVIGTANITAQDQRFDDYIVTEKGLYFNPKRIPEASKKIAQHIKDHKKISWMFFFTKLYKISNK